MGSLGATIPPQKWHALNTPWPSRQFWHSAGLSPSDLTSDQVSQLNSGIGSASCSGSSSTSKSTTPATILTNIGHLGEHAIRALNSNGFNAFQICITVSGGKGM